MPSIAPTIPSTKPAMKPPPMMRLATAMGKTTTLPIVPYPRIISMEPTMMMRPTTTPITNEKCTSQPTNS